ncbi:gamma carbonic anhydrase family protein [Rhodomicrobium vannielii]|uniref:gamma carbonic anhydrase family protein n=1 Tax=Rhodomicrobium vannielii TaxID=1069 RepID=UPI001FF03B32|nr:hypothetical protein [Rhodomicrobium vannielii]
MPYLRPSAPLRAGLPAPQIHSDVFIADTAKILGDVHIAEGASVWHYAVVRGDANAIRIGRRTNIQDGAIIHCRAGYPVSIGDEVPSDTEPSFTDARSQIIASSDLARGCSTA